ncbi:hypothetical protein [Luteolibacter sp. LG18]|uniref:hypothetical protein n=1 Tax=Luteolibacter sp. LG18 TaxID=2819286 RepID=UPI002B326196|nr:hypothetical protein llg_44570 [Luteolibacter sp. LG18]
MKKAFALLAALMSGGYLLTLGIAPDPLPFVDEATALLILVKSLSVLGIDVSRFVPFLGRKTRTEPAKASEQTVDI